MLPLIHLQDTLNLTQKKQCMSEYLRKRTLDSRRSRSTQERLYVVVVGTADHPFGIVVDKLLNQQEMVIKSMGNLLKEIPCVAGGAGPGPGR